MLATWMEQLRVQAAELASPRLLSYLETRADREQHVHAALLKPMPYFALIAERLRTVATGPSSGVRDDPDGKEN
jgi:hypothetical protein